MVSTYMKDSFKGEKVNKNANVANENIKLKNLVRLLDLDLREQKEKYKHINKFV